MPHKKTSLRTPRTAWFNPVPGTPDAEALEIIIELESKGFSFREIVVDAVLKAAGSTPEMFNSGGQSQARQLDSIEVQLQSLIELMKQGGHNPKAVLGQQDNSDDDEADGSGTSPFARNLANGFQQRQQKALSESGNDDE